jgi:NADPH2 dehydrogenase
MYRRLAQLRTAEQFAEHIRLPDIQLDFDAELLPPSTSPLAQPYSLITDNWSLTLPNRFCILPMEGWDGTTDGKPTDLTTRRWQGSVKAEQN